MSDSHEKKLDELLSGAVELRPRPDFAKWRQEHPEAIDALRSLPTVIAKRRYTMTRIARYSTSAAAVLLFLAAGAWWMFFSQSTRDAWAEAIDQLAKVRSATCYRHVHNVEIGRVSKTYLEGSRVRSEYSDGFSVVDFADGKSLRVTKSTKTASIGDLKKHASSSLVLGSNPLIDLIQMKNAPAERLPDEQIGDTLCRVYRVKDTAFMGRKVPWVKLWLDPDSKLPVQIHSVVADRHPMTFYDFRWNEPFDKGLLAIVVPEGYKLAESPKSEEPSEAVVPPLSGGAASNDVGNGPNAEAGREIPVGEIAEILDMLGQRIESNYKAMKSWSGTFDVIEQSSRTADPQYNDPQYKRSSHATVEFFAEPGRDRIRVNYRAVEPVKLTGNSAMSPANELPECRWVKTAEEFLRFPVSKWEYHDQGFSRFAGLNSGKPFKVLYREPPKAAEQYGFQGDTNPLSFFSSGWLPASELCSPTAQMLRGELGSDILEYGKNNTALRVRPKDAGTEYVLTRRFKPAELDTIAQWAFSSEAGFNVVSVEIRMRGQLWEVQHNKFRKENGIFIPHEVEVTRYDDQNAKDSPTQHHAYVLKQTQVNEPIDPAMFEIQSMGLKKGDRMIDLIENQTHVFDGKEFVLEGSLKFRPRADVKDDESPRDSSISNMKQLGLGMNVYHGANESFPARAIFDKNGKPLLSWRVQMLLYLDQGALYDKFHLDEPWDSPHNKKLIEPMPAVFRSPQSEAPTNTTTYLVPVGPGTLFEGNKGRSFREITDGSSNTIMLVEANDDQAVIWTKPDDLEYDQQDPMRDLVGLWPDGFLAGLADGSVRFIWSSIDPTVLKAFFTHNGQEKVGTEALEQ
jgi:uncharacterized protein DUF1559